jgi:hypothetical protein
MEKGHRIKTGIIAVDNVVAAHFTKNNLPQVRLAQHVWYVAHHLCLCVCVCVCVCLCVGRGLFSLSLLWVMVYSLCR